MFVWACIAPHGGELIPELANGNLDRMRVTRGAMETLGQRCREADPDTIIVYTPHGFDFEGRLTITVSASTEGAVEGERGRRVDCRHEVDVELAQGLTVVGAQAGLPMAQALFDPYGNTVEPAPLDWGVTVPLWFMGSKRKEKPKIVVVCPSRALSRRQLLEFGEVTAKVADKSDKRVALICSADQGHGHLADGPYGYSNTSASYDRAYCRAVEENDLGKLLHWRDDWIESALPDSFWQTLMLHGALQAASMQLELHSYEAPTYFGMACASCRPVTSEKPAGGKLNGHS